MNRSGYPRPSSVSQGLAATTAAGLGVVLLKLLPSVELGLFAAGAARLASLFTGQPVLRVENGWMLPDADLSIVVTAGCSATDFFLMVATLLAWCLMGRADARSSAAPQPKVTPGILSIAASAAKLKWIEVDRPVPGRERRSRFRKNAAILGFPNRSHSSGEQPPESLAGTSSATPETEERSRERSKRKIDTRIAERFADGLLSLADLWSLGSAALGGLVFALPLSIFLNSLRVVVVAQAHRWFIDHFPPSYGPLLHMAVGVAIFLPSLIALNGLFHLLASRRPAVSASA